MTDQKTAEELTKELAGLKTFIDKIPEKWDSKLAKSGICEEGYEEKHKKEKRPVIHIPEGGGYGEWDVCEEHYSYKSGERRRKFVEEAKGIEDELKFRTLMEKITRSSQLKDIVPNLRELIKRQRDLPYDRRETSVLSTEDRARVQNLLRLLYKIKPKSSQFMDRGVAVSEDLYISGTVRERTSYYGDRERAEPKIVVTALDQDEKYKSIAKVRLTLGEAERFRTLMTEAIEHVRISRMIFDIETQLKIKLPESKEDYDDET